MKLFSFLNKTTSSESKSLKTLFYDCETVNCFPNPNQPLDTKLQFSCNDNENGTLFVGIIDPNNFTIDGNYSFPSEYLQMFRYSYCKDISSEKIITQRPSIDFVTDNCDVTIITDETTKLPCNYLAITVGGNVINYHYGLREDQEKLYSVSFALPLELPNNVFLIMMDLQGEEPFNFEAQGQCQKQKVNNRTDKLTCQAIDPDRNKINGEVLVPSFNIQEIIRELQ